MALSASKFQLITNIQTFATQFENVRLLAEQITNMYFNAGFNGGGSNPIADNDGASFGLTAAQIAAMISEAQQVGNFFKNQAVLTGNYQTINDQARTT